jgi:hypothetical protein
MSPTVSIIYRRQLNSHLRGRVESPTGGKVSQRLTEPASRLRRPIR